MKLEFQIVTNGRKYKIQYMLPHPYGPGTWHDWVLNGADDKPCVEEYPTLKMAQKALDDLERIRDGSDNKWTPVEANG